MPRTKVPKFKIGDAIEIVNFAPDITVTAIVVDRFNTYNYKIWFFEPMDEFDIDMDDDYRDILTIEEAGFGRFILCDTEYCNECEYNEICPRLKEIARCDISEFGQLRGEGKVDIDVCKERKCKHLFFCGARRFIQK